MGDASRQPTQLLATKSGGDIPKYAAQSSHGRIRKLPRTNPVGRTSYIQDGGRMLSKQLFLVRVLLSANAIKPFIRKNRPSFHLTSDCAFAKLRFSYG